MSSQDNNDPRMDAPAARPPAPRPEWFTGIGRSLVYLGNNRTSLAGIILTTASALTMISFYLSEEAGFHANPYVGIIGFLILPESDGGV